VTKIGLVLGGGGITGFAYMTTALGVLQEITDWDPRSADVIVGTSAGANMGGLLRGGTSIAQSLDDIMTLPMNPESMEHLRIITGGDTDRNFRMLPTSLKLAAGEATRGRSLRASRIVSGLLPYGNVRTAPIGYRLRELHPETWPDDDLYVVTVRLHDGKRVVFGLDRTDITVGTAVEASSAIPGHFQPVEIDGAQYVDGGAHSPTSADLLKNHDLDLIVVVAPMSVDSYKKGWMMLNGGLRVFWRSQIHREVDRLRESGHAVLLLEPTLAEARAMGPTLMDPKRIHNVVMETTSTAHQTMRETRIGSELEILRAAS